MNGPLLTSRRRGQVMIVVLLAIVLLMGLVLFVLNVGDQINRRIATQNAADAAAISGGVQMARSMNVVAKNNIAASRLLSLVPIMDSLPLATRISLEEIDAWERALEAQLAVSGQFPNDPIRQPMIDGLESLRTRLATQRDILLPIDQLFNQGGVDISTKTVYRIRGRQDAPPHGSFWDAAWRLDRFSAATIDSAGVTAQINASRYAQVSTADAGFIVPVVPVLPALRGRWSHWSIDPGRRNSVLVNGRPPDLAIEPEPYRLGGFDKLLRWRDAAYAYEYGDDVYHPPTGGQRRGDNHRLVGGRTVGDSGVGRGRPAYSSPSVVGRNLIGYRSYGPYEWMRRRVRDFWYRKLRDTNFNEYFSRLASTKLSYMFIPPAVRTTRRIHYPQWYTDYPTCKVLVAGGARVSYTMFYKVSIRSRYPKDDAKFMSAGSYYTTAGRPQTIRSRGWVDPASWSSVQQIAQWVWEDQWSYETTEDRRIGILQPANLPEPEWFPVYMVDRYVFGGIDVGGEWPVTDPANYEDGDPLPAPYLLDTETHGDYDPLNPGHDEGVRRDVFSYLGVARRGATPTVWVSRFGTSNPLGSIAAVAQVEVYNPTSWGLWTEDWRAQLVPVTRMDEWTQRMDQDRQNLYPVQDVVSSEDYDALLEYFSKFDPRMTSVGLNH